MKKLHNRIVEAIKNGHISAPAISAALNVPLHKIKAEMTAYHQRYEQAIERTLASVRTEDQHANALRNHENNRGQP